MQRCIHFMPMGSAGWPGNLLGTMVGGSLQFKHKTFWLSGGNGEHITCIDSMPSPFYAVPSNPIVEKKIHIESAKGIILNILTISLRFLQKIFMNWMLANARPEHSNAFKVIKYLLAISTLPKTIRAIRFNLIPLAYYIITSIRSLLNRFWGHIW